MFQPAGRYYKNVTDVLRKKKLGNKEAKSLLSRSMNLFSVGSNDYGACFVSNISVLQRYSKHQFVDIVIGNITEAIKVGVCVCFAEINDHNFFLSSILVLPIVLFLSLDFPIFPLECFSATAHQFGKKKTYKDCYFKNSGCKKHTKTVILKTVVEDTTTVFKKQWL